MKKIIFIAVMALFVSVSSFAQSGIKFESGSLKTILAKAKAENKLVFMDVYASWCGPCKRMASDVFTVKRVGDYFNSTFVNAKFDAEVGEGVEVAKKYEVKSYPTFLLLNAEGEVVGKMIGGSDADDFIKKIKDLASKVK